MNPLKRFGNYFGKKTTKQKVLFVIGLLLIAVFAFFFIKGNFFDNKRTANESGSSYSEGTSQDGDTAQTAPDKQPKFHVGIVDIVIIIAIIAAYVIRTIIKKHNNRRM